MVALDVAVGAEDGTPEYTSATPRAHPGPYVQSAGPGVSRLALLVRGARCAGCLKAIESAVAALPGVTSARLNLSSGRLTVLWRTGDLDPVDIIDTLMSKGYPATPFDPAEAKREDDETGRMLLLCLAVAGFAAANVMLLSVSVWADGAGEMGEATRAFFHWVSALIAIPAALYAGRPFFLSAFRALKAGRANMDVPISLAVLLALAMSLAQTMSGGDHAYFEAAVMLLFFLLIGRYLDYRLRQRARGAARDLIAMQMVTANTISADGRVEAVAARDLRIGDRLHLAPGDRVPVDSVIEIGTGAVDCALVTGESAPVTVHPGGTLYAGVVNLDQSLVARVSATLENSLVADLARLIEAGEQSRNRYTRLADRAAKVYVPLVHGVALATFLGWVFIAQSSVETALLHAIALLIITCPCALGLAVPAVQVVATGRLFKSGVLVKSGDALERLAETDTVVFDKTGTLTLGRPRLTGSETQGPADLNLAAMLARGSRHPLSRALADEAGPGPVAETLREVPGAGLEADIGGETVRLGRASWVGVSDPEAEQLQASVLYLRKGDAPAVRFSFEDCLRTDAAASVQALSHMGFAVEVLSGDRSGAVQSIVKQLGIGDARAELMPQDKITHLETLRREGKRVLMVGDGLNDAPALAGAHASMSPGTAADVSQAAADLVFQGERLGAVVEAVKVARLARRRILENFTFAALYNLCAVPLAAAGFVTPLIAALAMSGSSVLVTLNALRLAQGQGKN